MTKRSTDNRDFLTVELSVWVGISLIAMFPAITQLGKIPAGDLYDAFNFEILVAAAIFLFPIVFNIIFKAPPLIYLRRKINISDREDVTLTMGENDTEETFELKIQAHDSKLIADKIFNRSGVYLISGTAISFVGLIFFYIQTKEFQLTDSTIIQYIPNFGILFFIEFIAFFFLRLYRSTINDYRYFEEIKRRREEFYSTLRILISRGDTSMIPEIINSRANWKPGILEDGQTTETLEAKKLEKDEIDLLEKIVSLLNRK